MLRISPHQDIKHALLISDIRELVTAHRYRHASRVHGGRSTAVEDCHAADALYDGCDFGLEQDQLVMFFKVGHEEVVVTSIRLVAAQWAGPKRGTRGS